MAQKNYTSKSQRYMTPESLYKPILAFEGLDCFTTDIACENMNIPAEKYRTVNGEFDAGDFVFKLSDRTGLSGEYGDGTHFCNPPWVDSKKFLNIIKNETDSNKNCHFWCVLDANRFETKYYTETISKNINCFWVFLPKTGFLIPEQPLDAPIPSVKAMWVYFGQDAEEKAIAFDNYLEEKGIFGTVVYNYINALK